MSYKEYIYLEGGPPIEWVVRVLAEPVDTVEVNGCLYRRTERLMGDCTIFEFERIP